MLFEEVMDPLLPDPLEQISPGKELILRFGLAYPSLIEEKKTKKNKKQWLKFPWITRKMETKIIASCHSTHQKSIRFALLLCPF